MTLKNKRTRFTKHVGVRADVALKRQIKLIQDAHGIRSESAAVRFAVNAVAKKLGGKHE